jgi:hypothetical protein
MSCRGRGEIRRPTVTDVDIDRSVQGLPRCSGEQFALGISFMPAAAEVSIFRKKFCECRSSMIRRRVPEVRPPA